MTNLLTIPATKPDEFGYHSFTCPSCGKEKYGDKDKHIELCSRVSGPVSMDAIAFATAQKAQIDAAVAQAISRMEEQFKQQARAQAEAAVGKPVPTDPHTEAAIQKLVEDGLSRNLAAMIVAEKGADYVLPDFQHPTA